MQKVSKDEVVKIRVKYPSRYLIIMVSRLTPFKRHATAIKAIVPFLNRGIDLRLLIMDSGPKLSELQSFVKNEGHDDRIHFLGFQSNVLDYIAASDIMIHPSLTDASNSAVKEAGLFEKLVLVCNKVGDFNDYIVDGESGYLLNANSFEEECKSILNDVFENRVSVDEIGRELKKAVISKFSYSEAIVDKYETL